MSLRWKLALAMVLLSSLATIAFGVASYRSTEQRLMAEVDRSLVEVDPAAAIERVLGGGSLTADGFDRISVEIVGADNVVITTTFPEPIRRPISSQIVTVTTSDGDYRVRSTQYQRGVVAYVGRPLAETDRVLDGVRNRTILLIGLVAALAAVLGWWLADLITGPLRRLTAAADDVAASGRPEAGVARIPPAGRAGSADEVARLSSGFARMLRALVSSQEEQERLVQDAGHELRTPLTSLRTNLDTLRRYPDISPEQRAAILDDLHAETEQLSALVDEIIGLASGSLTAASLAEGSAESYENFDATAVATELAERYARRSKRPVTVDGPSVHVVADRAAVQRAISNLLDNARKFDASGAPIEVHVEPREDTVRVSVGDRGPGIPHDELGLVFDRFHRTVEARTLPGSGLGLSIVKAVAERHGGSVHAANRDGGGAVVGFTIPVEPAGSERPG